MPVLSPTQPSKLDHMCSDRLCEKRAAAFRAGELDDCRAPKSIRGALGGGWPQACTQPWLPQQCRVECLDRDVKRSTSLENVEASSGRASAKHAVHEL